MSTAPIVATPRPSETAMSLLGKGVPLSLLLDLAFGPRSEEILFVERAQLPVQRPAPA